MINGNAENLKAPIRQIAAKVGLTYNGATLAITNNDDLVSVNIERVGGSKFFGYGISQKATIKVRDPQRQYDIPNNAYYTVSFDEYSAFPQFYTQDVKRNENTNELTITALDKLAAAASHSVKELNLTSYTIGEFAQACAALLGVGIVLPPYAEFDLAYAEGANFDGTETIRQALDGVAEATQTVYYIDYLNRLVFKRLGESGSMATVDKAQYFTLDCKTAKELTSICSVTDLGDNVEATTGDIGVTQYVRNNPFWELREDLAQLVTNAIDNLGGITINQINCKWRGNYLLEPTDELAFITKDNNIVLSYLINDSITYNGGFTQVTKWEYADSEKEHSNPATLGEAIKETYARVDKANKQIEMVASEAQANKKAIAALELNAGSITASVSDLQKATNDSLGAINGEIADLTNSVNATMTSEQINLAIKTEISNGVDKVKTTEKNYTFDDTGLSISSSDNQLSTTITENGMKVFNEATEVLKADKEGVKAIDLHATTYLIIGKNSRFEDYGSNRTGCFWIGG